MGLRSNLSGGTSDTADTADTADTEAAPLTQTARQMIQARISRLKNDRGSGDKWLSFAAAMAQPTKTGSFGESLGYGAEALAKSSEAEAKARSEREDLMLKYQLELEKQKPTPDTDVPVQGGINQYDDNTYGRVQTILLKSGYQIKKYLDRPEWPIQRTWVGFGAAPTAAPTATPSVKAPPGGETVAAPAPVSAPTAGPAGDTTPEAGGPGTEPWRKFIGRPTHGRDIGAPNPDALYFPTEAGIGDPMKGTTVYTGDEAIRRSGGTATRVAMDETGKPTMLSEADRLPTLGEFQSNLANARSGIQQEQEKINSLMRLSSQLTPLTTGLAAITRFVPGSAGMKVAGMIKTAVANITFDKLQEMRRMSASGASGLGATTGTEIEKLAASIADLNQAQDPKTLKENADIVIRRYNAVLRSMLADGQQTARTYQRVNGILNPEPKTEAKVRVYNQKTGKFD